jgi:hypothetical protein
MKKKIPDFLDRRSGSNCANKDNVNLGELPRIPPSYPMVPAITLSSKNRIYLRDTGITNPYPR